METIGPGQDYKTREGNTIHIAGNGAACRIYIHGTLETPRTGVLKDNYRSIPRVFFIGHDFNIPLTSGSINIVSNRSHRAVVPYLIFSSNNRGNMILKTGSLCDQFPVYVARYDSIKDFMAENPERGEGYVLLTEDSSRIDTMTLKIKHPGLIVLIIKAKEEEVDGQPQDTSKVRATDIVNEEPGELVGDPVFLARIHLRNLDLEAVRELILKFHLSREDFQFIRGFLGIMIKNERKDKDLMAAYDELFHIDELYRVSMILFHENMEEFDQELEKGFHYRVAGYLIPVVRNLREKTQNKDVEIYFWEAEHRLAKMKTN